MIVAYAKISLFFPHARSLKDKRQNLKSIKERSKHRFNISLSEVEDMDLWQKATIGIAVVSQTKFQAEKQLRSVRSYIESLNKAQIADFVIDLVKA